MWNEGTNFEKDWLDDAQDRSPDPQKQAFQGDMPQILTLDGGQHSGSLLANVILEGNMSCNGVSVKVLGLTQGSWAGSLGCE